MKKDYLQLVFLGYKGYRICETMYPAIQIKYVGFEGYVHQEKAYQFGSINELQMVTLFEQGNNILIPDKKCYIQLKVNDLYFNEMTVRAGGYYEIKIDGMIELQFMVKSLSIPSYSLEMEKIYPHNYENFSEQTWKLYLTTKYGFIPLSGSDEIKNAEDGQWEDDEYIFDWNIFVPSDKTQIVFVLDNQEENTNSLCVGSKVTKYVGINLYYGCFKT